MNEPGQRQQTSHFPDLLLLLIVREKLYLGRLKSNSSSNSENTFYTTSTAHCQYRLHGHRI